MSRLRSQQGYQLYRTIKNAADAALDSTFASAVPDTIEVYDMDEIVCQPFMATASQVIVIEPHWYKQDGTLLTIGDPMTFTAHATSKVSKIIEDEAAAAEVFPAPFDYCINPGADLLRLKVTTAPSGDVGIYIGKRA